jgi:hypothetical protein
MESLKNPAKPMLTDLRASNSKLRLQTQKTVNTEPGTIDYSLSAKSKPDEGSSNRVNVERDIALLPTVTKQNAKVKEEMRVAQTAFILFSTFLDLRPVSDASD